MDPDNKTVNLPSVDGTGLDANDNTGGSPPSKTQSVNDDQNSSNSQIAAHIPVPDEAADSDLIEKEWVERAKQIVEHTKDDPYEQQRAIIQMKADYMKKRYNKDINSAAD